MSDIDSALVALSKRVAEIEEKHRVQKIHWWWIIALGALAVGFMGFKLGYDLPRQIDDKFDADVKKSIALARQFADEAQAIVNRMRPTISPDGNSVNGHMRFGNLVMCWGRQEASQSRTPENFENRDTSKPEGLKYRIVLSASFSYPVTFKARPTVTCSVFPDHSTAGSAGEAARYIIYSADFGDSARQRLDLNLRSIDNDSHHQTVWVQYMAIGEVSD